MEYEEKIPEDTKGDQPEVLIESIEFRNVYFSYKGKRVIKNLSFVIEGGKTYAFVGHNGAGKTTIVKLLLRFYDPDQGMILLNGKNIMLYDLKEYRKLFATAFQDYQMFSLSLAENVLMRKVKDSDEEIVVNLVSFIDRKSVV